MSKRWGPPHRFQDLGTGRNQRRVLLGNTDDARTATFYFAGTISHNWPSWNEIAIKVDKHIKIFDTITKTINGRPAYFFPSNELTEDLWHRQNEMQKLLKWIESARPQDFIVIAELVIEETGAEYRVCKYPGLEKMNLRRVQIEIRKLSVSALRRLNSLTNVEGGEKPPIALAA